MATVREGNRGVLLVVDVQVGVMREAWDAPRVIRTSREPCAFERGYDLTLIKDAHTTADMKLDNGTKLDAASMIQDLNIAMKWLNYSGRANGTATAKEIEFPNPGGAR
jgi:hypothetical protein